MEPIFLAQLLGLYFIIMGIIVLIRGKAIMPTVRDFSTNRALLLAIAAIEIVAGLAIVLLYPAAAWSVSGIIAVVGYMMIVEGIIYLAAPSKFVQRFIRAFNKKWWYIIGGIASVVAGIYLAGSGFGFL
jgi:hypothetical protein